MAVDKDGKQKRPMAMRKKCRLYAKATFTGFQRGQRIQHPNVALLNIEGCQNKQDAMYVSI